MTIKKELNDEWDNFIQKNSQDPYSKGTVDYAKRWANLMEEKINEGSLLKDIANKLSHQADTDGITGAMYSISVQILSRFWEYGEELRRWHNLKYQLRNEGELANLKEGGVLNTAVLEIGEPK